MTSRLRYYTHQGRRPHPTTLVRRISTGILLPILIVLAAAFFATGVVFIPTPYLYQSGTLLAALGASVLRLFSAYFLALLFGIPLGLLAESNPRIENVLLPAYDVLESLPVLAFFPVIILFFLKSGLLEGAAVFIIFFTMLWTIAFSTIGGLKQIPKDVKAAGKVFGLSGLKRLTSIILPALFPPLLTASILAVADGWNIVIAAEALHAYVPNDAHTPDLFGIGSILVSSSATGNTQVMFVAMFILVAFIAVVNMFLWQPLLSHAERYKFDV